MKRKGKERDLAMKKGGSKAAKAKGRAAAANTTKWREESQDAREALDAGLRSEAGSPDADMFEAIPRMQQNLAEFWRKHSQDFTDYWTRLPDAEKRGFLLASSPYMTEGPYVEPPPPYLTFAVRCVLTSFVCCVRARACACVCVCMRACVCVCVMCGVVWRAAAGGSRRTC
jgi:hypothetical protein